ncbi:hypothetical protein SLS63_010733 [Diaporthe eres]|uniref:STAS domain-containing protein n=1 Tax=Diaporthe eres TaxID=83184 RepID=A0ABR1NWD1_DIAER
MDKLKKKGQDIKLFFKTDWNIVRARRYARRSGREIRYGAGRYLANKFPIVQWIASYSPKWLFGDVLSGVTVGVVLLRTLAISISAIVFLAALQIVSQKFGKKKTVAGRAARVGFNMGGLLVVLIFTIVSFLFLQNVPIAQQVAPSIPPTMGGAAAAPASGPAATSLPQASVNTTSTGAAQIIIPAKREEPRFAPGAEFPSGSIGSGVQRRSELLPNGQPSNVSVAAASTASAAGAPPPLPKLPFWAAFPGFKASIVSPLPPITDLIKALLLPSLLVFIVLNIEHLVVAKTFGHYHTYTVSQNSEMFAAGLSNLAGAFFGGVPVGGGDMARSSLLAVTGAKSPLNQIFTAVTVLVVMMPLSGALRFLPQAALSAIIVVAVIDQQPPQKLLGDYFRLSFADFLAFFMAFNIAIVVPAVGVAIGTAVGVGLLVLYTLFRAMFSRPKAIYAPDLEYMFKEREFRPWQQGDMIPLGTQVLKLETDMVWTNADRIRRHVVDTCMINNSGVAVDSLDKAERPWNFRIHEHVAALRRKHNVMADDDDSESLIPRRPRLRVVVLDMTSTSFIDSSAILNLEMMKRQLREWAGDSVEFRFVGLNAHVSKRFERAKWQIIDPCGPRVVEEGEEYTTKDLKFDHLPHAIHFMNPQMTLNGMWEEVAVVMGQDIDKIDKAYV